MFSKERFYAKAIKKGPPIRKEHLEERTRKVVNAFCAYKGSIKRILDIGCNDGSISLFLKEVVCAEEVYGVEISKEGVELSNKKGIKALEMDVDVEGLPFEDDYFDAIFVGELIEHLFDPDHLLDEIYRTLRKGGICIITTPNLGAWYNRIALLFGFQPFSTGVSLRYNVGKLVKYGEDEGSLHLRVFTYRSLKELVKLHKFAILKTQGANEGLIFIDDKKVINAPILFRVVGVAFSIFPGLSRKMIFTLQK